jgi:hypothetical protein
MVHADIHVETMVHTYAQKPLHTDTNNANADIHNNCAQLRASMSRQRHIPPPTSGNIVALLSGSLKMLAKSILQNFYHDESQPHGNTVAKQNFL